MSKYDFAVDLTDNTSTGLLLHKIAAGSSVLEFGCAEGRMTRYMKEELGCSVTIVEYDAEAFAKAMKFAIAGLCDDIMQFRWEEQFAGQKYDYILFADVLEHLPDPETVLQKVKKFLKSDGMILLSIPNITHNDMVLKAIHDRVDYTDIGLLDNTHLHFWGAKNIPDLAQRCGLNIERIEATYCPTGKTENALEEKNLNGSLLKNFLASRTCGEIYQFVVTMSLRTCTPRIQLRNPSVEVCFYLDTGEGFRAQQCLQVMAEKKENGVYSLRHVFDDVKNVKRIRFDPVEGQSCILRELVCKQGKKQLPMAFTDSIDLDSSILLLGDDPWVTIDVDDQAGAVVLEAEIILPGQSYLEIVQESISSIMHDEHISRVSLKKMMEELENVIEKKDALERCLEESHDKYNALESKCEHLQEQCHFIEERLTLEEKRNQDLEKKLIYLQMQKQQAEQDTSAYARLAYVKDEQLLRTESELRNLQELWCVRLHLLSVRAYRKIRRIAGRVLRMCGLVK